MFKIVFVIKLIEYRFCTGFIFNLPNLLYLKVYLKQNYVNLDTQEKFKNGVGFVLGFTASFNYKFSNCTPNIMIFVIIYLLILFVCFMAF